MPEGRKIRRRIKVLGIDTPVLVTLSSSGIDFRMPGAHRGLTQTLEEIIASCHIPDDIDPIFNGSSADYLRFTAWNHAIRKKQVERKKSKRQKLGRTR